MVGNDFYPNSIIFLASYMLFLLESEDEADPLSL